MLVDEENTVGLAIAKELGLKALKDGKYRLANGTKTPIGLCRTIQRIYDFRRRRIGLPFQQRDRPQNHSRRAVPALQAPLFHEGRCQNPTLLLGNALQRGHLHAFDGFWLAKTGKDGPAIHHDRTTATGPLRGASVFR